MLALLIAVASMWIGAASARAADAVKIGVLRFVSSGGLFLAKERGYFSAEGLDVELVFFEAAQPIAVAVASGDIAFGVTAITGGTLNLAGKGALKMIASQGAERKGYRGNAIVVSKAAHARGIDSLDKLAGTTVAITQIGSSFHYMMGQIAMARGFDLERVELKPLQSVPNMVAAVRSGQIDAALLPPHIAGPLVEKGEVVQLGSFSDVANYQYGAVFAAPRMIAENRALVQRFVDAYARGNADFAAAFLSGSTSGQPSPDETARAAAALIARYVYPGDQPEKSTPAVIAAAGFVDAAARLDVADIERQVNWYQKEKLVDARVSAAQVVDASFAR